VKRRSSIKEAEGPSSILHALPLRSEPSKSRPIVVQKFGGTSVGTLDRIRNVARRVVATRRAGVDVVVVVSAMAGETNRLLGLANAVGAPNVPDRAELDVIAAAGEQVAAGLLSLAILAEGERSRSFLGGQVRVVTDAAYGDGRVKSVEVEALKKSLERDEIPVVAGFQGVDEHGRVVTLGRGGSDTSAVVVAAALRAICEIYTDVDGVYAADPTTVPGARKLARCSLDKMLALASHGAKVLHPRSVAVAKAHGVTMYVRSSFSEDQGTLLTHDDAPLEGPTFVGVTQDRGIAMVYVTAASEVDAVRLLATLSAQRVSVDMVSRGPANGPAACALTFAAPRVEIPRVLDVIASAGAIVRVEADVAKVTLVGSGLSAPSLVARFLDVAIAEGAYPAAMIAEEGTLRCVVPDTLAKQLVCALYAEFFAEPSTRDLELRSGPDDSSMQPARRIA